jgi:hypothetical protein
MTAAKTRPGEHRAWEQQHRGRRKDERVPYALGHVRSAIDTPPMGNASRLEDCKGSVDSEWVQREYGSESFASHEATAAHILPTSIRCVFPHDVFSWIER